MHPSRPGRQRWRPGTSVFPHSASPSNLAVLRSYQRPWLRGDLVAGVTVAAYLVPQVMAYATVAGLPPVAGLWAILPCLLIYSVLGSSRQLSVGPESTTAVLTASIVAPLAAGDPGRYAGIAAELAVVFGVFCLAAWLLRLGFVAELLSRPVLVGYISGVAVIMALGQLDKITGIPVTGSNLWTQSRSLFGQLDQFRPATAAVAAGTIALLVVLHRYWPGAPGALIAVVVMTVLVAVLGLDRHGVVLTGSFAGGLPRPRLPGTGQLADLLLPAAGILIVGYTDNILTARSFARRAGYAVDANRELLALGACNAGSGLVGGFPVSSSASRTALGAAAGSRTQLYSLTALAAVLGTLAFLRPALAHFPRAALGGLVIYAAIRLIDLAEFRRLGHFRRQELLLALAATAGVLAFDILYGVLLAVGLSIAALLSRVARPHDAVLGTVAGLPGMHDVDDYPEAMQIPHVLIYRYDSPLFFANAENFTRRALAALAEQATEPAWFILNVEAIVEADITGLDALESVRSRLAGRGIVFALAQVKQDLRADLAAYGLVDSIGGDRLFPTLPDALAAYARWAALESR